MISIHRLRRHSITGVGDRLWEHSITEGVTP